MVILACVFEPSCGTSKTNYYKKLIDNGWSVYYQL